MKILLMIVLFFLVSFSGSAFSCSSDYSCGIGSICVKAAFQNTGSCMKSVNEYGTQQFNSPRQDSFGVNTDVAGQCNFNTDCPVSFRCDGSLKVCLKR